jgi:hypothetical protein
MILSEQIKLWNAAGIVLEVDGDDLVIRAPSQLITPSLKAIIQAHKPHLLSLLRQPKCGQWREGYDERAAIRHHDGNLPLHEAQYIARREVLYDYVAAYYPALLMEFNALIEQGRLH